MESTKGQLEELKCIETQMFCAFIEVCSKLKLRYYLLGGTLLGAVRHHGFIPWDDDIDVGMPRDDYEVFLQKAQALLPQYLFVQSIYSDVEYVMPFAKIRNCNTAFIETSVNHLNINHGVFIDVFPLDNYPTDPNEQKKLDRKAALLNERIAMVFNHKEKRSWKTRIKQLAIRLYCPSLKCAIHKREALFRSVPVGELVVNHGGAWGKKEIVPAKWYAEGTDLTFEGVQVKGPAQYKKWLTQVYGDYMQLPPVEKRMTHHYADVIDLKKSYKDYLGR